MIDVDKYIKSVRRYLKEENKLLKVDELVIDMLRENLLLLNKVMERLEKKIDMKDRYGNIIPSPFIRTKNDLENKIAEAVKNLGLSPAARKKIMADAEQSKSPLEEFMKNDDDNLPNQLDLFDVDDL